MAIFEAGFPYLFQKHPFSRSLRFLREFLRFAGIQGRTLTSINFEKKNMWVFPKIGGKPPKWMVKIRENPIKMDDLGGPPLFLETPMYQVILLDLFMDGE